MKKAIIIIAITILGIELIVAMKYKFRFDDNDIFQFGNYYNDNDIVKVGRLNNYAPIALVDNEIVYNYLSDSTLVIGNYNIDLNIGNDLISIENFYISTGITAVIDAVVYLPITLHTNEHDILKIDLNSKSTEILFIGYYSYPIDYIYAMDNKIYMLSSDVEENGIQTYYVSYFIPTSKETEICLEKNSADGENIKAFSCNNGILYLVIENNNDIFIETYDKNGGFIETIYINDEIKESVLSSDISQFYCLDDYIYLRNYSDYGAIAKIDDNQLNTLLILPKLRIAYNNKNTVDTYYTFFIREGNEIYVFDPHNENISTLDIQSLENESIRNIISDGNDLCISILDDSNHEFYDTKETLIVDMINLMSEE